MKVLIVSDNHRDVNSLEELMDIYQNEIDLWLHCGDSELDATHPVWKTFKTVSGNMDFHSDFPSYRVEKCEDETFLVVHGHNHRIRTTFDLLADLAIENDANIVFYGHTHIAKVDKHREIYFINPGSIVQPRSALRIGTYAIYEKNNDGEFINYYDWNHNKVEELSQELS